MFLPAVKFTYSPIWSLEFPSFCCFCCSVVSGSLPPHGLQHSRLPCPSPSPGACSNSCPLSQWCHPTISFSVIPFSFYLQSFPASGFFFFSASWLFASVGQSIEALVSASATPVNIQNWFPLGFTDLISLLSPRTLKSLLQQHSSKASVLWCSAFFGPTLTSIHDYCKNHTFDYTELLSAR